MLKTETILSLARNPDVRIGIGSRSGSEKIIESIRKSRELGYGQAILYRDPVEMLTDLSAGVIKAAVRGDMDSHEIIKAIKEIFGVPGLMRAAALEPPSGTLFFLAPVGIDEGWGLEEKIEFIRLGKEFLENFGIRPRFGILSAGRLSDIGRNEVIDRSIRQAEEVVGWGKRAGLDIEHDEILIEKAVSTRNFILAPDGVTGNLIFRTLHFIGKGRALGAPVLNLNEIFVDTSRAKQSYVDSIAFAAALVNRKYRYKELSRGVDHETGD